MRYQFFDPFNVSFSVIVILLIAGGMLTGCNLTDSGTVEPDIVHEYEFRESEADWEPFFTDYNVNQEEDMELRAEYRSLPQPLDTTDSGHFISALNLSDDVKMMYRKQVENLEPNTEYNVQFELRLATDVPSGCVGIGGPPGEAVRVIADASQMRPESFVEDEYYRLNVQHAADTQQWYQDAIMGDIANSRECEDGYEYEIKELQSDPGHAVVTTDENGSAWLQFGTRSGFEGRTGIFYTYIKAEFSQI